MSLFKAVLRAGLLVMACSCETDCEDINSVVQLGLKKLRHMDALNGEADQNIRVKIVEGKLMRGDVEVLPLGANYVVKGPPYFPPVETVVGDAKFFAEGVATMKYKPSGNRQVIPVVRLGTLLEGAMPKEKGVFDATWQASLENTVKAFAQEGVYVILDIHQDVMSTTNGGEGLPPWMTNYMQNTDGAPGCVWTENFCKGKWYTVSPKRPLKSVFPWVDLKCIQNCSSDNAWLAFNADGTAGNPTLMNAGNVNMLANTFNMSWSGGDMGMSYQVQNVAWRFYRACQYEEDKTNIFDPYMSFVRYLVSVWESHTNVIAIDLLNEPDFGGLANMQNLQWTYTRSDLFGMYAQILDELDAEPNVTEAIFIVEDVGAQNGQTPISAHFMDKLLSPTAKSLSTLKSWTTKSQLMYEFHWYPGQEAGQHSIESLQDMIKVAAMFTAQLGYPPLYLGEYQIFSYSAAAPLTPLESTAYWMSQAAETTWTSKKGKEFSISAITYWEYANSTFTGNQGWCKTPPGVTLKTFNGLATGKAEDWSAWAKYEDTMFAGESWGACITGFYPAMSNDFGNVLAEVPPV